jgi:hypothetical protein
MSGNLSVQKIICRIMHELELMSRDLTHRWHNLLKGLSCERNWKCWVDSFNHIIVAFKKAPETPVQIKLLLSHNRVSRKQSTLGRKMTGKGV